MLYVDCCDRLPLIVYTLRVRYDMCRVKIALNIWRLMDHEGLCLRYGYAFMAYLENKNLLRKINKEMLNTSAGIEEV